MHHAGIYHAGMRHAGMHHAGMRHIVCDAHLKSSCIPRGEHPQCLKPGLQA